MVKVISVAFALLYFGCFAGQKNAKKPPMQWQTIEEVQKLQTLHPRPIIFDVYTTWCVYCKAMDNTTWSHPALQKYIKEHFYAIKFDAESKAPLTWQGEEFAFKPAYKVHMLAAKLLGGNMVYPSTAIVPPHGDPIVIPGFVPAKDLEATLHYFGEKHYLTTEWKVFKEKYVPIWK